MRLFAHVREEGSRARNLVQLSPGFLSRRVTGLCEIITICSPGLHLSVLRHLTGSLGALHNHDKARAVPSAVNFKIYKQKQNIRRITDRIASMDQMLESYARLKIRHE
jgi:hypothetical protein